MTNLNDINLQARRALSQRDWLTVERNAQIILEQAQLSGEGQFLLGIMARSKGEIPKAVAQLQACSNVNPKRYDAMVELANIYSKQRENGNASELLSKATPLMQDDPRYLDSAGTTYVEIGMPTSAWPLYLRANELQPNIDIFKANLANCAVYVGEFEKAEELYDWLLEKNPWHRQNHYHYARLVKAKNTDHIDEMLNLLDEPNVPDNRNTPICFAVGKEYEDLGDWDNAFKYYAKGNVIVSGIIKYDQQPDIELTEAIAKYCSADWFEERTPSVKETSQSPIFIAGLPRTGTTLIERILTSHSKIGTVGETMFVQQSAAAFSPDHRNIFSPEAYEAFLPRCAEIPSKYMNAIAYRLGDDPFFIEKLPLNFLFLGPLAKAWPNARFIVLNRNPMDTAFSLFKQVFTWAYKFSYDLEHIGQYYVAYRKLMDHWKQILGDRLIEVDYETMVAAPEAETRKLLMSIGLEYEEACINIHDNAAPSTTASSVQVRSKISSSSIGKWKKFEPQMSDLKAFFENNGIDV